MVTCSCVDGTSAGSPSANWLALGAERRVGRLDRCQAFCSSAGSLSGRRRNTRESSDWLALNQCVSRRGQRGARRTGPTKPASKREQPRAQLDLRPTRLDSSEFPVAVWRPQLIMFERAHDAFDLGPSKAAQTLARLRAPNSRSLRIDATASRAPVGL